MNALLRNPLVLGVVALIVGLILGMAIAWNVWPVTATNTTPPTLAEQYRTVYFQNVADIYSGNRDINYARGLLGYDTSTSKQILQDLDALAKSSSVRNKEAVTALRTALQQSAPATPPAVAPTSNPLVPICAGALVIAFLIIGAFLILPRLQGSGAPKETPLAVRSAQSSKAIEPTAWKGEEDKPLAQFVTKYELGDDRYDTSFSIETATGDFLGECGVGIGETIGVGDPDKVTAFEVWLFDKNDIRTVTKVLMSEYAFGDATIRSKMAAKGEPELARPDAVVELETASLKIRARVVDMEYGMGELQPRSFFNKLTLELAAWPKQTVPAAA